MSINHYKFHILTASSGSCDPPTSHHYSSIEQVEQVEQEYGYHVLEAGSLEDQRGSISDGKDLSILAENER